MRNTRLQEIRLLTKLLNAVIIAFIVLTLVAMLIPADSGPSPKSLRINCAGNLKQIYLALQAYQADNHGVLPAHLRAEQLGPYVGMDRESFVRVLRCPGKDSDRAPRYGYSGASTRGDSEVRPLAFSPPGSHEGKWVNVLFSDGTIECLRTNRFCALSRERRLLSDQEVALYNAGKSP